MNMSNSIAQMILKMLDQDGSTEIQRNEFAQEIGYLQLCRTSPEPVGRKK